MFWIWTAAFASFVVWAIIKAILDPSIAPLYQLIWKCWRKAGEDSDSCYDSAWGALLPADQLATSPRCYFMIAETGLAGARVIHDLGVPVLLDNFLMALCAALCFAVCAVLTCWAHNRQVHVYTILILSAPDNNTDATYWKLPEVI